jgi:hypothetical protein
MSESITPVALRNAAPKLTIVDKQVYQGDSKLKINTVLCVPGWNSFGSV